MKHYIYIYFDPRDATPIYIGKGIGRPFMWLIIHVLLNR